MGQEFAAHSLIDDGTKKQQFEDEIKRQIESKGKEYILGVEENEYIDYLTEKSKYEPLVIFEDTEIIDTPQTLKERVRSPHFRNEIEREYYIFKVRYKFSGSTFLFKLRPPQYKLRTYKIRLDEKTKEVSFSFPLYDRKPESFQRAKLGAFESAFGNLDNVNRWAKDWNRIVEGTIRRIFLEIKKKYSEERDFFESINLRTDSTTDSIFPVPVVKKIRIPEPKLDKNKEFSSVPTLSNKIYEDVLRVIYNVGKSIEKKQSLYIGKDEESLRDQFLLFLETRYESVAASGETFNKRGKTDIILKYSPDNSNIFVAECKFWNGAREFHKAINQLFDRYLTWRDSKVALIFFVDNKDFTRTIETVDIESSKHEYFVRGNGRRGDSSLSYVFRLSDDRDKEVFLEIMLFHFVSPKE